MSTAGGNEPYPVPMPATGLQAAEFEQDDLGGISISCGDVVYTDHATGIALLRISCRNATEARKLRRAMRREARDVAMRRAAFRIVHDSEATLTARAEPRPPAACRRARANA